VSFNSIWIMAGNTFLPPKINMWNDWWWLFGISSQTIVIFTFNMLLVNGKSFFRSQKTSNSFTCELQLHLNYGWLYILTTKNKYVEWLVMVAWCLKPNHHCFIHFQYAIALWKLIFQKSKIPNAHLLMNSRSIRNIDGSTL